MCLTQYAGDAEEVAAFVALCRAAGSDVPVLPGVPLVVDREGAELLASFHAAKLPSGFIDRLFAARDVRGGHPPRRRLRAGADRHGRGRRRGHRRRCPTRG
jgi:5,10-methylenetetrahydrofolate reductase